MSQIEIIRKRIGKKFFPKPIINSANFGYKYISQHINLKTKKVLEIGSGSCLLLTLLSVENKKIDFVGIDPDIQGFSIFNNTKKLLINKFNLKIFRDYNSANTCGKFDLIFAVDVLEHVTDIENLFLFVKKRLSKNGKFIVISPNSSFWYEPHFSLPILINKNITYSIFKKKINNIETSNNSSGLWQSLNFINTKKLELIGLKFNFKSKLHSNISSDIILRVFKDLDFKKRKFFVWSICYLAVKTSFIKLLNFKFLIKYLPYTYVEFTNK
jgi:2-polyprenyl-3-methyl-5-hydroxy-6-metoxy-1,4-benzoquinol methylase